MTAQDVRECLSLRWPPADYLSVDEAPEDSGRNGRKIDRLVIALWRSRGLERDAVEVKVSVGDWRREVKELAKADFWWHHAHRFWIAVPAEIAETVKAELPSGWGLLSCTPNESAKLVVKPQRHEADPLSWETTVGVMRAAANAGVNALAFAERRGREEGRRQGKEAALKASPDGILQRELADLRGRVADFESASGVKIDEWNARGIGEAVAIVMAEMQSPHWMADNVGRAAEFAESQARHAMEAAAQARAAAQKISEKLAEAARTTPAQPSLFEAA